MVGSRNEDRFSRKIYGLEDDERGGGRLAWNSIFGVGLLPRLQRRLLYGGVEGTVGDVDAAHVLG